MRLMNKILPSCEEVSRLTSEVLDESLPWGKRLGLSLHLRMCLWCRRNAQQLRLMRDLARRHAFSHPEEAKLSSNARQRIAQSLKQSGDQS